MNGRQRIIEKIRAGQVNWMARIGVEKHNFVTKNLEQISMRSKRWRK